MDLLTKTLKAKDFFSDNHENNIVGPFDVLANYPLTTSEAKHDYY